MVNKNTNEVNKLETKVNITFTMRMEPELYEQVKQSAFVNKRSIAKEIEFGIEQYLKKQN